MRILPMGKTSAEELIRGAIGVIPTDTIYGISASALDNKAITRVYDLRKRDQNKPFIVLISDVSDLAIFGVRPNKGQAEFLAKYWPGQVSVAFPVPSKKWEYLHRGLKTIVFRVPGDKKLRKLLNETGPLISTSVNPPGLRPARDLKEVESYFPDGLDFAINVGVLSGSPSTIVGFSKDGLHILRQGTVKIE